MHILHILAPPSQRVESSATHVNKCAIYRICKRVSHAVYRSGFVLHCFNTMESYVAETGVNVLKGRHQRKVCGHCNELLSYSAYRSHRSRYFIECEQRWINSQDSIVDLESSGEIVDDPSMDFSDSESYQTMDDQSGTLIFSYHGIVTNNHCTPWPLKEIH